MYGLITVSILKNGRFRHGPDNPYILQRGQIWRRKWESDLFGVTGSEGRKIVALGEDAGISVPADGVKQLHTDVATALQKSAHYIFASRSNMTVVGNHVHLLKIDRDQPLELSVDLDAFLAEIGINQSLDQMIQDEVFFHINEKNQWACGIKK